ncbi:hypothetical protein CPAST_c30940 [Clostridium pasteurianum DSM 525 = ATCC 6013]|uniref:Uncharacterized protein n=1 Tax=Clostridium pasteurianum DSM 525 = ATCC 6013 TaxID=1262449 RepID=A0A0H3JB59_CLOPA|nr:hypothetical protein CPAST_c30940 [Clostridium pasteurianum DSM 525 = ATCC 6013]AJA53148.1 hypothetical protein CLPA_c30940 [Clostridium pasteurianum DSM 525 = ATCC 6013]KRU10844.1 hypothetical protein CP6013_00091 [Clostridium pasteurianum DSM 525 = ATCC 6013]
MRGSFWRGFGCEERFTYLEDNIASVSCPLHFQFMPQELIP